MSCVSSALSHIQICTFVFGIAYCTNGKFELYCSRRYIVAVSKLCLRLASRLLSARYTDLFKLVYLVQGRFYVGAGEHLICCSLTQIQKLAGKM